jgi:hypothetical protein
MCVYVYLFQGVRVRRRLTLVKVFRFEKSVATSTSATSHASTVENRASAEHSLGPLILAVIWSASKARVFKVNSSVSARRMPLSASSRKSLRATTSAAANFVANSVPEFEPPCADVAACSITIGITAQSSMPPNYITGTKTDTTNPYFALDTIFENALILMI